MQKEKQVAAEYIKNKIGALNPKLLIILGSGLGGLADKIEDKIIIPYKDIPNFPSSSVKGHAGNLIAGRIEDKDVLAMQGRFHLYEGHDPSVITLVIHTFKLVGIEELFITNASGGLNENFDVGSLMLITDHINFSGRNPLIGPNDDDLSERFFPIAPAYDKEIADGLRQAAEQNGIHLNEGTYLMVSGPNYETPAEVRAFQILGADAVGMSTVPEIIVAAGAGLKVGAISVITNMAAGLQGSNLDHKDVLIKGQAAAIDLETILKEYLKAKQ